MMLPNPVVGLFIFPLIQVVATALMLLSPSLEIVSWGLIISSAISYSTGRAIRELVYVPLDREQKYQGKGFIDTVVFRLGDGLSSIILIGGLELLSYGIWIDWTILLSMAAQFYVIIKIARLFAESLKVGNDKVSQTVT
jgi:ATP/ADP translocase